MAWPSAPVWQLHSIYTRMNRWAKKGVLDRVFEKLQTEQIVRIKIEAFSLDSTSVKVHPDGTGALKKTAPGYRQISGRMEHQDSYGCRRCSNANNLLLSRGTRMMRLRAGRCWRILAHAGRPSNADG